MKKTNLGAAVAFTGAAVNLLLFLVKLYVASSCNSLSIYLDSYNNALDSVVCVAAGFGFILAKKNITENYPFGYGRSEGVVNFSVSVIIFITGLSFAYSSIGRIMYPLPIWYSTKYAVTICLTIPVKLLLFLFYRFSNKKLGSAVLKSLSLDCVLDFFVTLCSFTALTLSTQIGFSVDGVAGLLISVILVSEGIKNVRESFGVLLGKRDKALCEKIEQALIEKDEISSVKSVQCHIYGDRRIANVTVEVNSSSLSYGLIDEINNTLTPDLVDEIYINIGG